jgi:NADP-dependent aldehyde dehydrogenase
MAIQRWTRPVCWQNAPDTVLPPELREKNPMNIRRMVDGKWQ